MLKSVLHHVLEPKIFKSIYLGNVKDKVYENIMDNAAATYTLPLPKIQAQILHKYLSIQGERRIGAPTYTQKHFANTAYSKHVRFKADDEAEH